MDTLNSELRSQAINLGLCKQWQSLWTSDFDKDELIDMYKRGIDFSIANDWPSREFIRNNFSTLKLAKNGVYLDQRLDFKDGNALGHGIYVLLGDSSGTLKFDDWVAATVYLRHDSKVKILAGEHAKIFVRLYGNANVTVHEDSAPTSRVKIFNRKR